MGWFSPPHSGICLACCHLQHFAGDVQHQVQMTPGHVVEESAAPQMVSQCCLGRIAVPKGLTSCSKLKEVFPTPYPQWDITLQ